MKTIHESCVEDTHVATLLSVLRQAHAPDGGSPFAGSLLVEMRDVVMNVANAIFVSVTDTVHVALMRALWAMCVPSADPFPSGDAQDVACLMAVLFRPQANAPAPLVCECTFGLVEFGATSAPAELWKRSGVARPFVVFLPPSALDRPTVGWSHALESLASRRPTAHVVPRSDGEALSSDLSDAVPPSPTAAPGGGAIPSICFMHAHGKCLGKSGRSVDSCLQIHLRPAAVRCVHALCPPSALKPMRPRTIKASLSLGLKDHLQAVTGKRCKLHYLEVPAAVLEEPQRLTAGVLKYGEAFQQWLTTAAAPTPTPATASGPSKAAADPFFFVDVPLCDSFALAGTCPLGRNCGAIHSRLSEASTRDPTMKSAFSAISTAESAVAALPAAANCHAPNATGPTAAAELPVPTPRKKPSFAPQAQAIASCPVPAMPQATGMCIGGMLVPHLLYPPQYCEAVHFTHHHYPQAVHLPAFQGHVGLCVVGFPSQGTYDQPVFVQAFPAPPQYFQAHRTVPPAVATASVASSDSESWRSLGSITGDAPSFVASEPSPREGQQQPACTVDADRWVHRWQRTPAAVWSKGPEQCWGDLSGAAHSRPSEDSPPGAPGTEEAELVFLHGLVRQILLDDDG